jgi:hypothetical protein
VSCRVVSCRFVSFRFVSCRFVVSSRAGFRVPLLGREVLRWYTLASSESEQTWLEPYNPPAPWSIDNLRDSGYWLYNVPREPLPLVTSSSSIPVPSEHITSHTPISLRHTRPSKMSAALKIRSFKGNAEPGEDADEYLDDVQMAAEAWENGKGDTDSLETSLLRFFRQNLEPNYEAAWWWGGLSKEEKKSWNTVKSLFLKKFAELEFTDGKVGYEDTNEILGICQKAGQSIEEYLREAEYLHRKVKPVLRSTLAAAVIKGLQDP